MHQQQQQLLSKAINVYNNDFNDRFLTFNVTIGMLIAIIVVMHADMIIRVVEIESKMCQLMRHEKKQF
jgi:hypothetical protein